MCCRRMRHPTGINEIDVVGFALEREDVTGVKAAADYRNCVLCGAGNPAGPAYRFFPILTSSGGVGGSGLCRAACCTSWTAV